MFSLRIQFYFGHETVTVFAAFILGAKKKSQKQLSDCRTMAPQFRKEERNFLMMEFHKRKGGRDFLPGLIQDFQAQAQASLGKAGIKIMSANAFLVFLGQLRF